MLNKIRDLYVIGLFILLLSMSSSMPDKAYAERNSPIPIIGADRGVVSFPYYFKYCSSLKNEEIPVDCPIETKPAFDLEILQQLKSFVELLPHVARDEDGNTVDADQIQVDTIFVRQELKDRCDIYMEEIDNNILDQLFQAAYYLDIKPLQDAFARTIVKRISSDRVLFKNNGDVVDLVGAFERSGFILCNSIVTDTKDGMDTWFKKYVKLRRLGMNDFSISDYIGLYGQPPIENGVLDLSNKKITSLSGLHLIKNPRAVTTLNLSNNLIFSSEIDPELPKHPFVMFNNLKVLRLDKNRLQSIPIDFFQGLKSLKLHLSENQLVALPKQGFKPSLELLDINNNQMKEIPIEWLACSQNMMELDISNNRLTKVDVNAFKGLSKLKRLDLSGNKIDKLRVGTLMGLQSLEELNMHENMLTTLPEELFLFQGLGKLETLTLHSNKLNTLPFKAFMGLGVLKRLSLYDNELSGITPEVFQGLRKLEDLDLSFNEMSDSEIEKLKGLIGVPRG